MKFEIEIQKEHFFEFNTHTLKTLSSRGNDPEEDKKGFFYKYHLVIVWVVVFTFTLIGMPFFDPHVPSMAMVFILFFIFFFIYMYRMKKDYCPLENGPILGKHTIEVADEGLIEVSKLKQSIFKWECFVSVELTKNLILMYVDRAMAILIPKDAFENEAELNQFLKAVEDNRAL